MSLSELARDTNFPRRTIQYWFDNDVLGAEDFELARMLVPFVSMALPIGQIKVLAKVLRTTVFNHQTEDEARHYMPHVRAARGGRPAVLGVQFIPTPGNPDETFTFLLRAAKSAKALAGWIDQSLVHRRCPIVVINLTEALRHAPSSK